MELINSGGIDPISSYVPVHRKSKVLTNREIEVINLITDGLNYDEIASKLYLSRSTVRNHMTNILAKFNLKNRIQLIAFVRSSYLILISRKKLSSLGLTQREIEILELIIRGHRNKDIALSLAIAEKTVRNHLSNILVKTKCKNRLNLITKILNIKY